MSRNRKNDLPRYLECHPLNKAYYYKNPAMATKANLGRNQSIAVTLAKSLNTTYRIQLEQQAARLETSLDFGSVTFGPAFEEFVHKYIRDYRLKSSTAQLLRQRQRRLTRQLGEIQVPALTTRILRESIVACSQFEQSKMKTLLLHFFRYAKSSGSFPSHLPNPADDLFIDPVPPKLRRRITVEQFRAIHSVSPPWLQWLMTLALHLALRRTDLVHLRFDDIVGDRIVSHIRKTDTQVREIEATSVDFPIHPDVRRVVAASRRSSMRLGRSPFLIHRVPDRLTKRMCDALLNGRLVHPSQVLPQFASKGFSRAREIAARETNLFMGLTSRQLPTLHEIRALSSHLYAKAGYEVAAVQDLMAHTDADMTRAYQRGHARKVLRVEMTLPWSMTDGTLDSVREPRAKYSAAHRNTIRENSLRIL